jgi:hypothetical protein
MPLYTYVAFYKGSSFAVQARRSTFQGFTMGWAGKAARVALPNLTEPQWRELADKAMRTRFEPVDGCAHVWARASDVGGERFTAYAVQVAK